MIILAVWNSDVHLSQLKKFKAGAETQDICRVTTAGRYVAFFCFSIHLFSTQSVVSMFMHALAWSPHSLAGQLLANTPELDALCTIKGR